MKSIFLYILLIVCITAQGQQLNEYYFGKSVGIDKGRNGFAHSSASLEIGDTASKKGTILSRVIHRDSVASPLYGMIVYDKSDNQYYYRNRTAWVLFGSGGDGPTIPRIKRLGNGVYTQVVGDSVQINLGGPALSNILITGNNTYEFNVREFSYASISTSSGNLNLSPNSAGLGIIEGPNIISVVDHISLGTGTFVRSGRFAVLADPENPLSAYFDIQGGNFRFRPKGANPVVGDLYRVGSDGLLERLPIGSNNQVLTVVSGLPTWANSAGGGSTAWGDLTGVPAALTNLIGVSTNGGLYRTGTNTYAARTLTGTSNRITITNPDGVAGNPTINVGSDVTINNATQVLTNKTIDGSTNNLMNIGTLGVNYGPTSAVLTLTTGSPTPLLGATATTAGLQDNLNKRFTDSLMANLIADSTYSKIIVGITGNYDSVYNYIKAYGKTTYDSVFSHFIPKYQVTGNVQAGTNMTMTGNGTPSDPYIFNSTASGGGGGTVALSGAVTGSGNVGETISTTLSSNIVGTTNIQNSAVTDGKLGTGINANKIGTGSVDNTEIGYLDGVTSAIQTQINAKQNTLVSGTSIKTINGESLLGPGNIPIAGGSGSSVTGSFSPTVGLTSGINAGTVTAGEFTYTKTDSVSTIFGTVNFQVTGSGYAGVEMTLPSTVKGLYNFESENQLSGTGTGKTGENITPVFLEPVIGDNHFMLWLNAPAAGTYKIKLQMGVRTTQEPPVAVIDTAKFNFSLTARAVSGWTNLIGNPHLAVITGTSNGVTISTTATGNWTPESPGVTAAQNAAPAVAVAGWPADLGLDYFFNRKSAAPANAAAEHLTVSGLKPLTTYTVQWLGSRTTADPTRQMYYTIRDNAGVTTSPIHDAKGNTTIIVTMTAMSNGSGIIYLSGYGAGTHANALYCYYNALKIYENAL